jgi:hypothetical protein
LPKVDLTGDHSLRSAERRPEPKPDDETRNGRTSACRESPF